MRAILPPAPGAPPIPLLGTLPDPEPGPDEVLVAVRATALNRADLLQLHGLYPPPPGESPIPGLECAGEILALGAEVSGWRIGQRVMALLAGGGHAETVAVPSGQLMDIPANLSFVEAAALPEAALTAWTNLVVEGELAPDETLLITGAASGVGAFAVQLARELGARVLVAGRSLERLERLRALGAEQCFELGDELPAAVRRATDGRGADVVLDLVGGRWVEMGLEALAPKGRHILLSLLAGSRVEIDLANLLTRRLRLVGSVLRGRGRAEKAALVSGFTDFALPRIASGRLRPVIDTVIPFEKAAEGYAMLAGGGVLGKIVLELETA